MNLRTAEYARAQSLAEAGNWHDLGLLATANLKCTDAAWTVASAAVDLLEDRPVETIAALRSILDAAPSPMMQIVHWVLAHAMARQAHVVGVASLLDGYLDWRPYYNRQSLELTDGFVEAEGAFRAALAIQDLDSLWNDLGVLHFSFGRVEEAADYFGECLARDPAHRHASINYAVSLLTRGRVSEAHDFVARTAFAVQLPRSLTLNSAVHEIAAGRAAHLPSRDYRDWTRWCAYSFGWRRRLSQLFEPA